MAVVFDALRCAVGNNKDAILNGNENLPNAVSQSR